MTVRLMRSGLRLRGCARGAFSVIELLVVIVLVALLVGILVPALMKARERGKMTACLANQKQVGMAFQGYQGEYDGVLPRSGYGADPSWLELPTCGGDPEKSLIRSYLGGATLNRKLFVCPSDVETISGMKTPTGNLPWGSSYAMNSQLSAFKLVRIDAPATKVLLLEDAYRDDAAYWWWETGYTFSPDPGKWDHLSLRHPISTAPRGAGCVVFADGHAESLAATHENEAAWFNAYGSYTVGDPPLVSPLGAEPYNTMNWVTPATSWKAIVPTPP